ncbi:MAG: hypothetical protein HY695_24455 [Deltaproteobacteria bacterium]|nr:hypothetical protein [Deltaproteobacteria bacterium]
MQSISKKDASSGEQSEKTLKKSYQCPKLTCYGTIEELTGGGTGGNPEVPPLVGNTSEAV